jgi:hypothetical protein
MAFETPDLANSRASWLKRDYIRCSSLVAGREIVWQRKSNSGSNKCGGIPMASLIAAAARALARAIPSAS